MLVDTHAHLMDTAFAGDVPAEVEAALGGRLGRHEAVHPDRHQRRSEQQDEIGQHLCTYIAGVVLALRSIPIDGMPRSVRGHPVADENDRIRDAIEQLRTELGDDDADALHAIWDEAISAPHWKEPFLAVHGDLSGNNLLLGPDGHLAAVIDWSCFGLGEPANDLDVAWELLDAEGRRVYRDLLDVDDATWTRARGWVARAAYGIAYYRDTNPDIVERSWRRLHNVIDEYRES